MKHSDRSMAGEAPGALVDMDRREVRAPTALPRSSTVRAPEPLAGASRLIFGDPAERAVCIRCHAAAAAESGQEWMRNFRPDSVELCLNLAGRGELTCESGEAEYAEQTAGFYLPGAGGLRASRRAGDGHQFLTVNFARPFLRANLDGSDGALHPLLERFLRGGSRAAGVSATHRLGAEHQRLAAQMLEPPVAQAARALWFQSKVLGLMADFFFTREVDELFCDRQKRVAKERADRVVTILREQLADPPSLEEIGRAVGCSPFYLSRIFSKAMGMTIPQFLRQLRMERAAELLRTGKYNVTEAALEVGYSSISHFSQAFCQTIGCCPNLYPHARG